MMRHRPWVLALWIMVAGVPAAAAGLEATMTRLMSLFPGTYDTAAQVRAEADRGVPEVGRHDHRHVVYARIDAPQIGPYVLFRQERRGGASGEILTRGLAVFAEDPDVGGVRMWLRNIVAAEQFTDLHLRPELWNQVSFDPAYGGKCPFHWRLEGPEVVGTLLGGGCKITSNAGRPMSFEARWILNERSLSIFDNTYDGEGKLLAGRADRVPTRYDRTP